MAESEPPRAKAVAKPTARRRAARRVITSLQGTGAIIRGPLREPDRSATAPCYRDSYENPPIDRAGRCRRDGLPDDAAGGRPRGAGCADVHAGRRADSARQVRHAAIAPGEVAPMALLTYQDARPYARAIKDKVASRQMPPWFADPAGRRLRQRREADRRGDRHDHEVGGRRRTEGDPKRHAEAADLHRRLAARRAGSRSSSSPRSRFPATGDDYFPTPNITLDLKEDRWIRAIEIRPSNRAGHASLGDLLGERRRRMMGGEPALFDVLAVWAVGTPRDRLSGRHGPMGAQGPEAAHQPALPPERHAADRPHARRPVLRQGRAEEGSGRRARRQRDSSRFRRTRRTTSCTRSTSSIRTSTSSRSSRTCTCAART